MQQHNQERTVTEEQFWEFVDQLKVPLNSNDDIDKQTLLYRDSLEKLSFSELSDYIAIHRYFLAKAEMWNLMQAAFIVSNGCGDDDYLHFSAGLIAQGRDIFCSALSEPEGALLDLPGANMLKRCFQLTFAGEMVFREKTGTSANSVSKNGFEIKPNPAEDYEYSEDPIMLKQKFPKLFKKYWNQQS